MNTYAIGDVHGCLDELVKLLDLINFDSKYDSLIFTGDIINRGPKSLETIRFIKSLNSKNVVLGNHDMNLIYICYKAREKSHKDTIDDILSAHDKIEIIEWLRHCPLMVKCDDYTITHAGIPPIWSTSDAKYFASEIEDILQDDSNLTSMIKHMITNKSIKWSSILNRQMRIGLITNYLTRMRHCSIDGSLDLEYKTKDSNRFLPWFSHNNSKLKDNEKILFGHWSQLYGRTGNSKYICLDTGCVWGHYLTAYNIKTNKFLKIKSNFRYT